MLTLITSWALCWFSAMEQTRSVFISFAQRIRAALNARSLIYNI